MRNLKKYLAVIVAIAVMMTAMIPAFAEETAETTTIPADAKICADLGVLKGSGDGVTVEYLAGSVDRMQAARLYLRLKGLEAEALATDEDAENFPDADETNADGRKIMAYLKANPEHGFAGGESGNFGPNDQMEAQPYYKVLLTALGYAQKNEAGVGDFAYADTLTFAAEKGLSKVATVTDFTRADFATASVEALKATVKGGTKTLAATLVDAGKIDKDAAIAAGLYVDVPATFEVASVSATNLKEVVVVYNQAVDKASAETASKYRINNSIQVDSASLADDGVTVTVSLKDGNNAGTTKFVNQKEYEIDIKNIKVADGSSTSSFDDIKFTPKDVEVPLVTEVKSLGTKALKVTFSEPMNKVSTSMFKLDGKSYVGSITFDSGDKSATLKPYNSSTTIAPGAHTLTISGAEDFAPLKSEEQVIDFDVVEDKTAPQIVEVTATLEKAVVTFDEDVDPDTVSKNDFYWLSGTVKKYPNSVEVDGAKVTLKYNDGNRLPAYTITMYISGISDYSGNTLSASEVSVTPAVDQSRPEVSDVELADDQMSIKVTYSKDVTGSKRSDYSIKDKDGDTVRIKTINTVDADEYTIDLYEELPSGDNTLTISGVQDKTTLNNTMLPFTTTVTAEDKSAPEITTVTGSVRQIIVSFNEAMDIETITDLKNYTIKMGATLRSLPSDTEITAISNAKAALIVLPEKISDVTVNVGVAGNVTDIIVFAVEDVDGNTLKAGHYGKEWDIDTTNVTTKAYDDDTAQHALYEKKDVIKVRMSQPIVDAKKEAFTATWAAGGTNPVIDSVDVDNDLITLNFAEEALGTTTDGLRLSIVDGSKIKTVTEATVSPATNITIKDKVAPEVDLDLDDNQKAPVRQVAGVTTIEIPFTENITSTSASGIEAIASSLVIINNSDSSDPLEAMVDYQTSIGTGADSKKLIVTITPDVIDEDTDFTVTVKATNLIKDASENSFAADFGSFETGTALVSGLDKTPPVATFGTPVVSGATTTFTVTFDEAIKTQVTDAAALLTVDDAAAAGTVAWSGNIATVTLSSALTIAPHTINFVANAASDIFNNAIPATTDYSVTPVAADVTSPTVTSITGITAGSPTASFTITFSEALPSSARVTTVDALLASLSETDGSTTNTVTLDGPVTWNAAGTVATVYLSSPFTFTSGYTVTAEFEAVVADAAGNVVEDGTVTLP